MRSVLVALASTYRICLFQKCRLTCYSYTILHMLKPSLSSRSQLTFHRNLFRSQEDLTYPTRNSQWAHRFFQSFQRTPTLMCTQPMFNTENKTFQPLQVMLLFSLLRNNDLEKQRCTEHKVWTDGPQWHPCAVLHAWKWKTLHWAKGCTVDFWKDRV